MTPAGANFLDGRYAIFGYVTQGKEAPARNHSERYGEVY